MQKLSKILTVRKENLALRSKICYTVWSMLTCFTTQKPKCGGRSSEWKK